LIAKLEIATLPPSPYAKLLQMIQQQDAERNTPATTEPITTETEKDDGQESDQHAGDDAAD